MAWDKPYGYLPSYLLWGVLCMLWTWPSVSQPLLTVPYSLEEGLVQSQITAIYQDTQGYMWFGTLGGVSRFDGQQFTNFTVTEGLASNRTMGIAEDSQNRIWIATLKGINVIDGTSITHLTTRDGLLDDKVYELLGLPSGDIWIGSSNGLTYYDGHSFSHITEVDGLISSTIMALELDGNGNLWVGTSKGACILKDKEPTCYSVEDGLPHPLVNALLIDKRGRVWAGTPGGSAMLLPGGENRRFITLDYLPSQSIAGLLQDRSGALWISNRDGFSRINQQMEITDQWNNGEWIGSVLYEDREGTIWAGTYGRGVVQFRPTAFTNETQLLGLPEDVYLSVYEDPDSVLWVGTRIHGLFRIEREEVYNFDPKERPYLNHIRSIRQGPDGALWLAASSGVIRYDESGFRHFSQKDGFQSSYTYSVLPDSNGVTWAGTQRGLYKIYEEEVTPVPLPKGTSMVHTLDTIGDRTWVGTEEGLLYVEQDSVHKEPILQGIPILSITHDRSGQLWIGTMGSGVYKYDPIAKAITDSISTEDGLNSSAVYFVRLDNNNKLWVGTSKGINKVNLNHDRASNTWDIKQFGQKDGIVGIETNKNATTIDHKGRLWFGTLKGLMQYDAAFKPINILPPPVYLTELQLFLEDLPHSDSLFNGDLALSHNENHLTFNFLGLSFISPELVKYQYQMKGFDKGWSPATKNRFATYSNLPPGDYTFEVRASNSDGVWSTQPASLQFSIATPYWQTNWFQGLCAAGFLLLVIGIVQIRMYTIKKRSRQLQVMVKERTLELETTHTALLEAREDALQAARSRSAFLSTMTHELRTPMNGIMGMAQLLHFTELDEEQTDYSVTILDSSTTLLDMIENLLTFADLAAGKRVIQTEVFTIPRLIEESLTSINSKVQHKKLEVFTSISTHISQEIKADREHIRQIIKHLLSNAVKFTEQGMIYLEVDRREYQVENTTIHELVLSVHDTGIGIEASKLTEIFDSFTQLDMAHTRSFEGAGMGLTLSRHMAQLLEGTLRAESKPGIGSSFYLNLPVEEMGQAKPSAPLPSSRLAGKKVMIILHSERDRRRLALVCKSLDLVPELAKPSDLLGGVEEFDLVLSEIRLDNEGIHWYTQEQLADEEGLYAEEGIQGIVIDATISGTELKTAVRRILGDAPAAEESTDFHKDFGNSIQNN